MDRTHDFVIKPPENTTPRSRGKGNFSSRNRDRHNQVNLLKKFEEICVQVLSTVNMLEPYLELNWVGCLKQKSFSFPYF